MVGEDVLEVYKRKAKMMSLTPSERVFVVHTAILSSQTVNAVVSLGFATDETAESVGGEGARQTAVSTDIADVNLNRGVILGSNETVGGRAVQVKMALA